MQYEEIVKRQQLAEEYASFSLSRGGLGKVLGGIVGIIVILAGTLLGGGTLTAVLTIGATLVWLAGKEVIRTRLYRPFGDAAETWSADNRRVHQMTTAFVGIISLGILLFFITRSFPDSIGAWIYVFFVAMVPFIAWYFLRTPLEFIVGVFLLAACAVHGAGGAYSLLPPLNAAPGDLGIVLATWSPFIGAFVLIVVGLREHQHFRQLSAQMETKP